MSVETYIYSKFVGNYIAVLYTLAYDAPGMAIHVLRGIVDEKCH